MMWTRDFWIRAAERALRTFAQALLGALTAGLVVTDAAQWKAALIAAVVSTVHDPMIQQRLFRAYVSAFGRYDWWWGFSIYNIGGFGDSNYRLSLAAINYIRSIPTEG